MAEIIKMLEKINLEILVQMIQTVSCYKKTGRRKNIYILFCNLKNGFIIKTIYVFVVQTIYL